MERVCFCCVFFSGKIVLSLFPFHHHKVFWRGVGVVCNVINGRNEMEKNKLFAGETEKNGSGKE